MTWRPAVAKEGESLSFIWRSKGLLLVFNQWKHTWLSHSVQPFNTALLPWKRVYICLFLTEKRADICKYNAKLQTLKDRSFSFHCWTSCGVDPSSPCYACDWINEKSGKCWYCNSVLRNGRIVNYLACQMESLRHEFLLNKTFCWEACEEVF